MFSRQADAVAAAEGQHADLLKRAQCRNCRGPGRGAGLTLAGRLFLRGRAGIPARRRGGPYLLSCSLNTGGVVLALTSEACLVAPSFQPLPLRRRLSPEGIERVSMAARCRFDGSKRIDFLCLAAPCRLAACRRNWGRSRSRGRGRGRLVHRRRRRWRLRSTRRERHHGSHDGNHCRATPQPVAGHCCLGNGGHALPPSMNGSWATQSLKRILCKESNH